MEEKETVWGDRKIERESVREIERKIERETVRKRKRGGR